MYQQYNSDMKAIKNLQNINISQDLLDLQSQDEELKKELALFESCNDHNKTNTVNTDNTDNITNTNKTDTVNTNTDNISIVRRRKTSGRHDE